MIINHLSRLKKAIIMRSYSNHKRSNNKVPSSHSGTHLRRSTSHFPRPRRVSASTRSYRTITLKRSSMLYLTVRKSKRSRVKISTRSQLMRWTTRPRMMTDTTSLNQPLKIMLSIKKIRRKMIKQKSQRRKNTNKSILNIRRQLSTIRNTLLTKSTPLTKSTLIITKSTPPKRKARLKTMPRRNKLTASSTNMRR